VSTTIARRRAAARRNARQSHALRLVLILLLAVGALGAIGAAAGLGTAFAIYQHYADDYVPIQEKLQQTQVGLSEIYDRRGPDDGEFLGALPNPDAQLLSPVPLSQISDWMIAATISTEDNGFWDHPGVNLRGLVRAAYENYILDDFGEGTGGSSITQQLIKNVYICPSFGENVCTEGAERTLDRKLREIAYAIELEQDYTKEQILEWYLNQTAYADRYVGVQAAAEGYFRKDAIDLNLAEAALLAGIPSFPTRYHPRLNCVLVAGTADQCVVDGIGRTIVGGEAKARQEIVLDLMARHGAITRAEAEAAKAEDLRVYQSSNPIVAASFLDNQVEPRLVRMCEAGILPKLERATNCSQSVASAGYKVTTTLDWDLNQQALALAQERVALGLDARCECHNASVVTIDPTTGQVLVYVPNVDPTGDTIDPRIRPTVDQATEIQQPGSSLKPAIYLTWFEYNVKNPMSTFWDTSPLEVQGTEIENPRGGSLKSEGLISARAGLGGSQNVPAFRAAYEAGVDNVIQVAKQLGITTLDQGFDPTFRAHREISYGASIATGGANVRVIDMAYMNATLANMGVMVGVPHLARYVPLSELKSTQYDEGAAGLLAYDQRLAFARGHIRIPETRELDPVVILEVRDASGAVIYDHETANDLQRVEVINPGSVWLLHSIMSDCTARYIIWGCGGTNAGSGLDPFMADGTLIPGGLKTGTQQGPLDAADTLETWMNGYSRYAATAVWVGNANNDLVKDGPGVGFAAANATKALYRIWMGRFHDILQSRGVFTSPEGFSSLQPSNVRQVQYTTPATSTTGLSGGCDQTVTTWVRNDVSYASECEEHEIDTRNGLLAGPDTPAQYRETRKFVILPGLRPELARELAEKFAEAYPGISIPIAPEEVSTGAPALDILSPTNGAVVGADADVIGSVTPGNLVEWKLELGRGGSPVEWTELGAGKDSVVNAVLGRILLEGLEDGIYTLRLSARDRLLGNLSTAVGINIRPGDDGGPGDDDESPGPGGGTRTPRPGATPTPSGITHPLGFEECGGDATCGGGIIVVRCGPLGWFVDIPRVGLDYGGRDWPVFVVQSAADAPDRAAVACQP